MVLINIIAIHPNFLSSPFPHPCHSLFFSRDDLRSGIICDPGSFTVPGSFVDVHTSPFACSVHKSKCLLVHITKLRPVGGLELETSRHFFRKGDKFEKLSRTFEGKFTLYNLDSIPILPWISKQKCLIIFQKI